MRWGVLIATVTVLAGAHSAAQAQALTAAAFQAKPAAPLQLRFPGSDAAPERLTPGATWEEPALAPSDEGSRRFALTWNKPDSNWDISAAVNFIEKSRVNAADFQTGGLFETEAAVVRRFGSFRVGAVGYSARGAGEAVGYGPNLGSMRWKGSAAGPVVGYDAEVAGQPTTLSLRWYREIGTPGENGDTVSAAFALKF